MTQKTYTVWQRRILRFSAFTMLIGTIAFIMLMSIVFSSCVNDDQDDCGLNIRFRYTYNVKNADAFSHEVKSIDLYVFDEDGKYIKRYSDASEQFGAGYQMNIRDLKAGKYTFVCMARSEKAITDEDQEFQIARLGKGADINELTAHLDCNNGINGKQFAHLYVGKTSIDYSGNPQNATIDLLKCSNTYRILLLPTSKQANFIADNFDIRIVDANNWFDHKGDLLVNPISETDQEEVTHVPHSRSIATNNGTSTIEDSKEKQAKEGSDDGKDILASEDRDVALIYDLRSARLFRNDDTRLVITDKRSGKEVFNHSLPWLLSLYGGDQRHKDWDDQEYLDRQDHYTLTFYVDDTRDYSFTARVKVNGWILNLIDTDVK